MSIAMTDHDTETEAVTFGAWLREVRARTGMTQFALAKRLDISLTTVSRWENDHEYPKMRMIRAELERIGKRSGMPAMPGPPK